LAISVVGVGEGIAGACLAGQGGEGHGWRGAVRILLVWIWAGGVALVDSEGLDGGIGLGGSVQEHLFAGLAMVATAHAHRGGRLAGEAVGR